ncbi:hypothetical protein [Sphaerotilus sp.]|uniref:hypothetical protein n=1 Tax=Sphaerotilus sp. TaxID=2093942 RepID=UPI002ACE9E09|nr:hypothetical protein [Sphaerotilus sp.]MDZ7855245.1 hypothetical protein [Sphaerotilus sp.]
MHTTNTNKTFLAIAAALLCAATGTWAAPELPTTAEALDDKGFSYFIGLSQLHSHYREDVSLMPIRSKVTASSPLLVTGALYAVTPDWLLSLDNETTFAPRTATETWQATGPVVAGVTLSSPTLQTNRFRLSSSRTRMLVHHRWQDQFFLLGGPEFHSQSFRRYAYESGPDGLVRIVNGQTSEETSAEVVLALGAAIESEAVRHQPQHYSLRAMVGVPVWRRVESTSSPQARFTGLGGYDLTLEARYSRAVLDDVHLGGWVKFSRAERSRDTAGASLELPRSRLDGLAVGLELLWKL